MITFDGVTKQYGEGADSVLAIEDISFSLEEGEFVSLVGPSGSGKTTVLHMTTGILEPTNGSIAVAGTDVQSPKHQKHKVGLVFQQPVLLEWRTVRKNILLPVEIMHRNGLLDQDMGYYQERADELLQLVGLEQFDDAYPKELSGGMQQRVSICRSLIYDPPALLMDEPFGALDALTRQKMNEELLDIWQETEKTIFFVTHNLEEAVFLSDKVVVLSSRPGRVLDIVDVDLERPRNEDTRTQEEYHDCVSRVYEYFKDDQGPNQEAGARL